MPMNRVLIGVSVVVVACGFGSTQPHEFAKPSEELLAAVRSGGLPAGANLLGRYVSEAEEDVGFVVEDAFEVSQLSDVVVLARVTSKLSSSLTQDLKFINTDYQATIITPYRGSLTAGSSLKVRMSGGLIVFNNGTIAEQRSRRNPPIQADREYVFFLRAYPGEAGVFDPTLGSQGRVWVRRYSARRLIRSKHR